METQTHTHIHTPGTTGPQERPMPGKLCKALVAQLARQEKWGLNYAFDGRKNIYSPGRFLPPVRYCCCPSLTQLQMCSLCYKPYDIRYK